MNWNNAWLSNQDCNSDNILDRPSDEGGTYRGSGAWLTNHATGTYLSTKTWNIVGDWVLSFDYLGSFYIHDMTVVDNTFTGTGGYPSGGPYSITWTVTGTLTGDNIAMHIAYDASSYYVDAVGTIAPDGTMSGTWSNLSQSGTWTSTSGVATRPVCTVSDFVKVVAAPTECCS